MKEFDKIFQSQKTLTASIFRPSLGLLFFINWFTDFFIEILGTEDEIKIKIKYKTFT